MDWSATRSLSFEPPDFERFPALGLAFDVAEIGGTAPAVYNAANEIAVEAFLDGALKFTEIIDVIRETLKEMEFVAQPGLEDILEADREARRTATLIREKTAC